MAATARAAPPLRPASLGNLDDGTVGGRQQTAAMLAEYVKKRRSRLAWTQLVKNLPPVGIFLR
jgi:hypothetical protein